MPNYNLESMARGRSSLSKCLLLKRRNDMYIQRSRATTAPEREKMSAGLVSELGTRLGDSFEGAKAAD